MTVDAPTSSYDDRRAPSSQTPQWSLSHRGDETIIAISGSWSADQASAMETAVENVRKSLGSASRGSIDLSHVEHLDTAGAWILDRTRHELTALGWAIDFTVADQGHRILLDEIDHYDVVSNEHAIRPSLMNPLVSLGHAVSDFFRNVLTSLRFLGEVVTALGHVAVQPRLFRGTSLINQLDLVALRGAPIIVLISFLVGGIIAQQGIFQLRRFGATSFAVDLVGILTLRELGVLLTSIMLAGRSGSAFTAEIGSMKMREEIDAIRVMGLDPMEVLIIPRLLALIVGLPMLTFLADLAALAGGGLVSWLYESISPSIFLLRLKDAIALNTFLVGIVKAPFMALVIGLIASMEGFAVQGSAESLGRHVTSSVVKAIFIVIVIDGLFAMFFAAIDY